MSPVVRYSGLNHSVFSSTTDTTLQYLERIPRTTPWTPTPYSTIPFTWKFNLDANTPMSPRQAINSAPYAQIAGIAESVEGGSVDADNVSIQGSPVIDNTGTWVGQPVTPLWTNVQAFHPDLPMMSTMSCPVVKSSIMLKTNPTLTWQTPQQLVGTALSPAQPPFSPIGTTSRTNRQDS